MYLQILQRQFAWKLEISEYSLLVSKYIKGTCINFVAHNLSPSVIFLSHRFKPHHLKLDCLHIFLPVFLMFWNPLVVKALDPRLKCCGFESHPGSIPVSLTGWWWRAKDPLKCFKRSIGVYTILKSAKLYDHKIIINHSPLQSITRQSIFVLESWFVINLSNTKLFSKTLDILKLSSVFMSVFLQLTFVIFVIIWFTDWCRCHI